ncbi:NADH-quinone oxidoreductase subunit J [Buchnera aphidicola]|uniref:NADH-quinone oxidoreductase subunit J n=1 Tax=Buchnera aphidicola TaxID=9 RepID=UPI0030ECD791
MNYIFYFAGFFSIFFTILTIFQKNLVYALFYLIMSFFSVSAVYFSLGNVFIGVLEVIIYSGAIMALFVFVLMTLNFSKKDKFYKEYFFIEFIFKIFLTLILFLFLIISIFFLNQTEIIDKNVFTIKQIGIHLFDKYAILVEFVSIILLSSLIIVCNLGVKKKF